MYNLRNKKGASGALILAGLAAFAYYKYSQMSPEEKNKMVGDLKDKAKKLYEDYMPQEMKNMFDKKSETTAGATYGTDPDITV